MGVAGATLEPFSAENGDLLSLNGVQVDGSSKRRLKARDFGLTIFQGPVMEFRTDVHCKDAEGKDKWVSVKPMPGVAYGDRWISLPVSPATTLLFWILLFDLFGGNLKDARDMVHICK